MRRVVSVWLPTLATDRLRRRSGAPPADTPLVTRWHDGRRMIVAAADRAALALGLTPGLALAEAQARVPGLAVADADPAGDTAALARLAAWCLRLSPLTAPDTDGLWIDATGCTHLHGGEAAMLDTLLARLAQDGIAATAAIADTPGAAHAMARYGRARIVAPGGAAAALAPLPVAALRLGAEDAAGLRRLGFGSIAQLDATPRAPLTRRFGAIVVRRLDQALGRVDEPITPSVPPDTPTARAAFPEPLLTAEAFAAVIAGLATELCTMLDHAGLGARLLDLLFTRVDGSVQALRAAMARPTRDARHLGQLLTEQVERIDPGLGVETIQLIASAAEPLAAAQIAAMTMAPEPDLSVLVDRLANRLGPHRVWRAAAVESDVPERSVRRVPALSPPTGRAWPGWPRPARLLHPPQPVTVPVVQVPDYPPAAFIWRRHQHRVSRADGPERITGEWWRRDAERLAVRDYWQVEDDAGRRFWLYRSGDGVDAATGDLCWFLHGVF